MARRVRIVVGEGRAAQQGLLRFVLEGEGFDVVGEAKGTADLTELIESNEPDVVVLDDGIGVTAVSMIHEVAPQAKIVLVWPSAVVPIGGDARVEPAKILRDLGPAVTHVMAPAAALAATSERPDWVAKVRKDPTALRAAMLAAGKATTKRPSVTRLQRRSKRLHPTGSRSTPAERDPDDQIPAPVLLLPVGLAGAGAEPVLDIGGGAAGTGVGNAPVDERSEWNRRLGMLALSGAAAVSALVLALALGGGIVSPSLVRGGGQVPLGVPGFVQSGQTVLGPFGTGTLGGGGYDPTVTVVDQPSGPDQGGLPAGGDAGFSGDLAAPDGSGGSDVPAPTDDPGVDDGTGGGGTGGGGTGGGGTVGGGTGGGGTGGGGNGGGTQTKGGKSGIDSPGHSGEHNPHGGPPGHTGDTPAHGPGLGVGSSAEHGSHKHPRKH